MEQLSGGGCSIYLCLPQRFASQITGFLVLQPYSPCLDSEVLSLDPFVFTGVTQGAWEAQPLSVYQRANEVTSVEASDNVWRTNCPHLQTTPEGGKTGPHAQAATQYLATTSSLSASPGWDPSQALPPSLEAGGC